MLLYIIRHAQSTNNALADASARVCDPPLTELGWRQAELLGQHLLAGVNLDPLWSGDPASLHRNGHGYTIHRLFCSPMRRTLQTGDVIGRALGLTPEVWVDIHEEGGIWLDHGGEIGAVGYPGMTRGEILAGFPGFILPQEITETGWWRSGREDAPAVRARAERVARTLRGWAKRDERIALVTHGAFTSYLLRALLEQPPSLPTFYHQDNTGMTLVRFWPDDALSLRYLNRVDHLPVELIT